jgi:hypothetical protein
MSLTAKQHAYWTKRLNALRLMRAVIDLPEHTLWCVGDMEEGPFARLVLPQPNGGYVGGYVEGHGDTPAEAIASALQSLQVGGE